MSDMEKMDKEEIMIPVGNDIVDVPPPVGFVEHP
jgi:hypothetical protein